MSAATKTPTVSLREGDCRELLRQLPDDSVACCITSPPYLGLRNYTGSDEREIGREASLDEFVTALVEVFVEVRRVLHPAGTLWLNLGHSYGNDKQLLGAPWRAAFALQDDGWLLRSEVVWEKPNCLPSSVTDRPTISHETVFLFAKSRRYFYDADAVREPSASGPSDVRKQLETRERLGGKHKHLVDPLAAASSATNLGRRRAVGTPGSRNRRSVWRIATVPYRGQHTATMPPALAEVCLLAGTSERGCCPACGAPWRRIVAVGELRDHPLRAGRKAPAPQFDATRNAYAPSATLGKERQRRTIGWEPTCACAAGEPLPAVVLDPFAGTSTAGQVALEHGRSFVGIELSAANVELSRRRLAPWLAEAAIAEEGEAA